MKKFILTFTLTVFSVVLINAVPRAEVSVGISADNDGLKSFYLSVGEHYKVPEEQVVFVRDKKIPDEELPVVFFLARHASVEPGLIIDLRLGGKSWIDITGHFGLSPSIYYVAFQKDPGPPYGKAWGHYKNKKKDEWKTIRLADSDVVNFVNIKFMSERYGYTPEQVIKMREKGQSFVKVNTKMKKDKEAKQKQSKQHADADKTGKDNPSKDKSKGKKK